MVFDHAGREVARVQTQGSIVLELHVISKDVVREGYRTVAASAVVSS